MSIFIWLFRAFLFFALFAFALNNSDEVVVRWFFGREWHSPLVIVVLIAFGMGCALGVLAMVPAWWHHRRIAANRAPATGNTPAETDGNAAPLTPPPVIHDGL
ncbi:LapA family protein [Paucibacter sp. Y2R2-4]|uniref:LapA family protein n=1 Tax=Paucibacter sp. Y2R2-4 TaxID=2893553 RepID=UPI0021E35A8D|nr:LapA family protein [Paucibacter sp. Y2R2-4]MCV2348725.1 LapA family protein [Paucibacter sp. Y2R2-4]